MASNVPNLGGYDCKFVSEPPDHYICLICTFVAKDPQQMDCCGKVYCRLCLTEHKKHSNKCPQCRKEGNSFNDKRGDRDIKALKVKCDNFDNGCQWVGELRSLEEHVQKCDYTLLPCTNECKIHNQVVTVLRKDLANHLANNCPIRQYQCPNCKGMSVFEERNTVHLKTCPGVSVPCPNAQCPHYPLRCCIAIHRSSCDYEKVSCKYAELGCEERDLRMNMKKHEQNYQLHLQITTKSVLEYKKQLQQLEHENTKLKEVRHTQCNEKFTFKLPSFTEKKKYQDWFYSTPFYTSQNGYRFCISVVTNGNGDGEGTHLSVYACLMKGDNDDSLTWPFTGTVTVTLLNQLEDENHYAEKINFLADYSAGRIEGERGIGLGCPNFIAHSDLQENYLVDDALFFRVSVDVLNYKPWLECTRTD